MAVNESFDFFIFLFYRLETRREESSRHNIWNYLRFKFILYKNINGRY